MYMLSLVLKRLGVGSKHVRRPFCTQMLSAEYATKLACQPSISIKAFRSFSRVARCDVMLAAVLWIHQPLREALAQWSGPYCMEAGGTETDWGTEMVAAPLNKQ